MNKSVSTCKRTIRNLVEANRANFETAMRELQEEGLFAATTDLPVLSTPISMFTPTPAPTSAPPTSAPPTSAPLASAPSTSQPLFAPTSQPLFATPSYHQMITRQRNRMQQEPPRYSRSLRDESKRKRPRRDVPLKDIHALKDAVDQYIDQHFEITIIQGNTLDADIQRRSHCSWANSGQ